MVLWRRLHPTACICAAASPPAGSGSRGGYGSGATAGGDSAEGRSSAQPSAIPTQVPPRSSYLISLGPLDDGDACKCQFGVAVRVFF